MAVGLLYARAIEGLWQREIDIDHIFKVMLTTSAHVPDQDLHDFKDDLTNEVSGSGYTAGGATLENPTLTYTSATNKWKFDADDVVAGKAIGVMLSLFFLYTMIAMSIVGYWTFRTIFP